MINILNYIANETNTISIVLRVTLILLITLMIARIFKKVYKSNEGKHKTYLFRRFVYSIAIAVIYIIGVLSAIGQIPALSNVVSTILAGSGILALAVSLSAQESLNNIISGLFITLFKPFEIGDRITLVNSKLTGTVEDITLRHTVVKTFINSRVVVPNSTINNDIIENSNLIDSRASSFVDVCIAYESDIHLAMDIMAEVIGDHPYFIDTRANKEEGPKVKVFVRELGESGIWLRASMWTQTIDDNFAACSDVRLQIKERFDESGVRIPYKVVEIRS